MLCQGVVNPSRTFSTFSFVLGSSMDFQEACSIYFIFVGFLSESIPDLKAIKFQGDPKPFFNRG